MPRAFIKPIVKQIAKGVSKKPPSSAAKRLTGMRFKIPGTGEYKTISNVTKDVRSKNTRWLEFDDGMTMKTDASEVHDLVEQYSGGKFIRAREEAGSDVFRGKQMTQNDVSRRVFNRAKEYGTRRAARIELDRRLKGARQIEVTLPKYVIAEQRGMYKIVPEEDAKRLSIIGEASIPRR